MPEFDTSYFIIAKDTPFVKLDCKDAFDGLSEKERLYAHYLTLASYYGSLIVFHQTSPESPLIFSLFLKLFKYQPITDLKRVALEKAGLTEEEWKAFTIYVAAFFGDFGNYKGFGDSKFVPELTKTKFEALIHNSRAYEEEKAALDSLISGALAKIYSLDEGERRLGFGPGGITTYHSANVEKSDSDRIDRYMKSKLLEGWNTRLFKTIDPNNEKISYEIRLASVEEGKVTGPEEFEGSSITITRGDYGPLLERVNHYLSLAKNHAANENQVRMLENYIEHFKTGKLDLHKDGSRFWIKDKGPAVESYIGFIENYRDPAGVRSEFEGFVAVVNRSTSEKFSRLVENAEKILSRLPWDQAYEKDKFLRPDFTGLDVLAFGGSGIPIDDDVRQNEGFKNVSLGNVIRAMPNIKITFLSPEDQELKKKYSKDANELQVGLHELLGHGSGKLFIHNRDGTYNFDTETVKDMETGQKITSWYEEGETYSSKFGALGSAYEECRAEAVGYYLCTFPEILKIFGYEDESTAETIKYVNLMEELRAGLTGLEFYSPEGNAWGQAHCHARFVLLMVALEAGQGFVEIKEFTNAEDGKPDLLVTVDRKKIDKVGAPAIATFLQKLQLYKSTGDVVKGKKLFDQYSAMTPQILHWRDIVIARRLPRRILVLANTFLEDNNVVLKTYPESADGVIESTIERFDDDKIDAEILNLWKKDEIHFK